MKKVFLVSGIILLVFVIFIFAVALSVYTNTEPQTQPLQENEAEEYVRPLTRLELLERKQVQDFKVEIERRKNLK